MCIAYNDHNPQSTLRLLVIFYVLNEMSQIKLYMLYTCTGVTVNIVTNFIERKMSH